MLLLKLLPKLSCILLAITTIGQSIFREHLMAVHDVKHHPSDLCDKPEHWPDDMRYKQDLVVGCGNLVSYCVIVKIWYHLMFISHYFAI